MPTVLAAATVTTQEAWAKLYAVSHGHQTHSTKSCHVGCKHNQLEPLQLLLAKQCYMCGSLCLEGVICMLCFSAASLASYMCDRKIRKFEGFWDWLILTFVGNLRHVLSECTHLR